MLHLAAIGDYVAFDPDECREMGRSLAQRYREAAPFPHIVLDNFIDPEVLRAVLTDFPSSDNKQFFDRDQERSKFQYQPHESPSGLVRNLFASSIAKHF
jgi:hypothetical protein